MKKIVMSIIFLVFMFGCSSKTDSYSKGTPSRIYTFDDISAQEIANVAASCFSNHKKTSARCNTNRASVDTLFRYNGQAKVQRLQKYKSLSDREGLVMFYVRSTGGIFYNITLFVSAKVTFNKYTGAITELSALNGKTARFKKSQDMEDSEPAFKVFKKGLDMMIRKHQSY